MTQRQTLQRAIAQVVGGDVKATDRFNMVAADNPAVAQAVPRIFIHQKNNAATAETIATVLRGKGYVVLAPDTVVPRISRTQILFYSKASPDAQTVSDVEEIKSVLRSARAEFEPIWVQQDVEHHHPYRTYAVFLLTNQSTSGG